MIMMMTMRMRMAMQMLMAMMMTTMMIMLMAMMMMMGSTTTTTKCRRRKIEDAALIETERETQRERDRERKKNRNEVQLAGRMALGSLSPSRCLRLSSGNCGLLFCSAFASLGMGKGLLPLPLSHRNVAPKEAFRMVLDRDRDARRCASVCHISTSACMCVCL